MRRQLFPTKALNIRTATAMGALIIGAACTASIAQAETMIIYNVSSDDAFIVSGEDGGIGNKILWNSEAQTEDGEKIGMGSGHCTQLDAAENFFCSFVIDLTDRGMIAGQGVQRTEPMVSTMPIVGGTGEFEGITGALYSRPVEDRARFIYEIEYETPALK